MLRGEFLPKVKRNYVIKETRHRLLGKKVFNFFRNIIENIRNIRGTLRLLHKLFFLLLVLGFVCNVIGARVANIFCVLGQFHVDGRCRALHVIQSRQRNVSYW